MDAQKVLDVLSIYSQQLSELSKYHPIAPERGDIVKKHPDSSDRLKKLSHVWWAVEQCRLFVKDGRMEKAFRWLGFIQGALWYDGMYAIEELANHSRPDGPLNMNPNRDADEWSDEVFLNYVSMHCRTERALFHVDHVWRLLELARATNEYSIRKPIPNSNIFRVMDADIALPLVERARKNLSGGQR